MKQFNNVILEHELRVSDYPETLKIGDYLVTIDTVLSERVYALRKITGFMRHHDGRIKVLATVEKISNDDLRQSWGTFIWRKTINRRDRYHCFISDSAEIATERYEDLVHQYSKLLEA